MEDLGRTWDAIYDAGALVGPHSAALRVVAPVVLLAAVIGLLALGVLGVFRRRTWFAVRRGRGFWVEGGGAVVLGVVYLLLAGFLGSMGVPFSFGLLGV